jgi:hypothetical protein
MPAPSQPQHPEVGCQKPLVTSRSMHEGVPDWHDVCCCEAEPRWVEVAHELGIDLDAGWEDRRP